MSPELAQCKYLLGLCTWRKKKSKICRKLLCIKINRQVNKKRNTPVFWGSVNLRLKWVSHKENNSVNAKVYSRHRYISVLRLRRRLTWRHCKKKTHNKWDLGLQCRISYSPKHCGHTWLNSWSVNNWHRLVDENLFVFYPLAWKLRAKKANSCACKQCDKDHLEGTERIQPSASKQLQKKELAGANVRCFLFLLNLNDWTLISCFVFVQWRTLWMWCLVP